MQMAEFPVEPMLSKTVRRVARPCRPKREHDGMLTP